MLRLRAFCPHNHRGSQQGVLPILPGPPPRTGAPLTVPTTATSSIGSTSTCCHGSRRSRGNVPSSEKPPLVSSFRDSLLLEPSQSTAARTFVSPVPLVHPPLTIADDASVLLPRLLPQKEEEGGESPSFVDRRDRGRGRQTGR